MLPAVPLIAWRFMLKGTERGRFSAMTLFAWLAIGVGVGTMSALLSVMYGLESSLRDNVLRAYPHILVRRVAKTPPTAEEQTKIQELIRGQTGVRRAMPFVETEMIAQSSSRTMGVVVWGVAEEEWERMAKNVRRGRPPSATSAFVEGVLGAELADHLRTDIKDTVHLLSPLRRGGALGAVPKSFPIRISGLYESGHYDFDKQYLFVPLLDAQDIVGKGPVLSGWHVWSDSLESADEVAKAISGFLPAGWEAQSWTQFNQALFHSLKLEQLSMFLILSFAVLIAVMNIAITLIMHVSHKRKNIGVLRALGASASQIQRIFMWQGAFLGMIGMGLGAILSAVLLYYIKNNYQFPDIYYQTSVPVEIRPLSILMIYAVCTVLVFLATIYPSIQASRLDPIEAIRE
ncbi:FtsX-like permease family protein [bacterium]|nr:FtsX-like permease family protein [bacterium]